MSLKQVYNVPEYTSYLSAICEARSSEVERDQAVVVDFQGF